MRRKMHYFGSEEATEGFDRANPTNPELAVHFRISWTSPDNTEPVGTQMLTDRQEWRDSTLYYVLSFGSTFWSACAPLLCHRPPPSAGKVRRRQNNFFEKRRRCPWQLITKRHAYFSYHGSTISVAPLGKCVLSQKTTATVPWRLREHSKPSFFLDLVTYLYSRREFHISKRAMVLVHETLHMWLITLLLLGCSFVNAKFLRHNFKDVHEIRWTDIDLTMRLPYIDLTSSEL